MFTIEVKKRGKDEKFDIRDLLQHAKISHNDCYGGNSVAVEGIIPREFVWCVCKRCGEISQKFFLNYQSLTAKTAIDGQERNIAEDVRVIQRI